MTHPNRDRWKEILGPEYDLMVKMFLVHINEIKKASQKTSFILPHNIQERILNADEEKPINPDDGIRKLMNDPDVMKSLGAYELFSALNNIEERLKCEQKKLHDDLARLAQELPEASKLFYTEAFTLPHEMIYKEMRPYLLKMKKQERDKFIKKSIKSYTAFTCGFMCQYMFHKLELLLEDDADATFSSNTDFWLTFVSSLNSFMSQIAFQSTIKDLLSKGDDESLLNAVRIDKSIVCSDILKHRIARAQFSGDMDFFKRLGNNIAYSPLEKEAMYYEAYLVLRTFWLAGLKLLKPKDLDYFLTACGIIHSPTPESLSKFIARTIHPIYGK